MNTVTNEQVKQVIVEEVTEEVTQRTLKKVFRTMWSLIKWVFTWTMRVLGVFLKLFIAAAEVESGRDDNFKNGYTKYHSLNIKSQWVYHSNND